MTLLLMPGLRCFHHICSIVDGFISVWVQERFFLTSLLFDTIYELWYDYEITNKIFHHISWQIYHHLYHLFVIFKKLFTRFKLGTNKLDNVLDSKNSHRFIADF